MSRAAVPARSATRAATVAQKQADARVAEARKVTAALEKEAKPRFVLDEQPT